MGKRALLTKDYRLRFLKGVFELAQESTPTIILLDKIDALCIGAHQTDVDEAWVQKKRAIMVELLVLMGSSAIYDRSCHKPVAVIATTNAPWIISRPVLRRFLNRRYCPLPNADARRRMLEIGIGSKPVPSDLSPVDYDTLVLMTNGHTGATISRLINRALAQASERPASSTSLKKITVSPEDGDSVKMCTPCSPEDLEALGVPDEHIPRDDVVLPPITLTYFLAILNNAELGEKIPEVEIEKYEQWKA